MSRTKRQHSQLFYIFDRPKWKEGSEWKSYDDDHSRFSSTEKFHMKRFARRRLRREGLEIIRNWEDEYHLNQHLEPFNWALDDAFDHDDYYIGLYDDPNWDDWDDRDHYLNEPEFDDPFDYYYDDYDYWGDDY